MTTLLVCLCLGGVRIENPRAERVRVETPGALTLEWLAGGEEVATLPLHATGPVVGEPASGQADVRRVGGDVVVVDARPADWAYLPAASWAARPTPQRQVRAVLVAGLIVATLLAATALRGRWRWAWPVLGVAAAGVAVAFAATAPDTAETGGTVTLPDGQVVGWRWVRNLADSPVTVSDPGLPIAADGAHLAALSPVLIYDGNTRTATVTLPPGYAVAFRRETPVAGEANLAAMARRGYLRPGVRVAERSPGTLVLEPDQ